MHRRYNSGGKRSGTQLQLRRLLNPGDQPSRWLKFQFAQCALTRLGTLVILAKRRQWNCPPNWTAVQAGDPFRLIATEDHNRKRMNFPISLTLLRIFFVPLLVVLLLTKGENLDLWAVGVFLLAACTDFLDGYLARKRGQITTLGILLDPMADKLLTCSAFISLVELGLVPAWMVVIIVGRELAVSGLRASASAQGFVLEASDLGKTKMVLQVVAITVIVLEQHYAVIGNFHAGVVLLWLVMVFALTSAAQYFWGFWKKLNRGVDQPEPHPMIFRVGEQKREEKEQQERDVAAR